MVNNTVVRSQWHWHSVSHYPSDVTGITTFRQIQHLPQIRPGTIKIMRLRSIELIIYAGKHTHIMIAEGWKIEENQIMIQVPHYLIEALDAFLKLAHHAQNKY